MKTTLTTNDDGAQDAPKPRRNAFRLPRQMRLALKLELMFTDAPLTELARKYGVHQTTASYYNLRLRRGGNGGNADFPAAAESSAPAASAKHEQTFRLPPREAARLDYEILFTDTPLRALARKYGLNRHAVSFRKRKLFGAFPRRPLPL